MNKILEAILSDIKNLIKIDNPKKFILSNIPIYHSSTLEISFLSTSILM